jgi:hypothetical protein
MSNSWTLFRVGTFELCSFLFRDIHLALKIFVIYNSTMHSSLFPFSSSRVLSPSGYVLSRLSMIVGSSVGGLTYLHFHLYPHMMNPTDHCSFPYLANFMVALVWVGTFELCCFLFRDIHLALKTFMIYNSTADSSNSQASLYHGSQMFRSICRCLLSPLTSCHS